jgi:hypothetical protein
MNLKVHKGRGELLIEQFDGSPEYILGSLIT